MSNLSILKTKIDCILIERNLSYSKLARLIDEHEPSVIAMIQKKRPFTSKALKKLFPLLAISQTEFESWVIADKYPRDLLESAIREKKDFPYKRKSILTAKIDAVLEEKGISRTTLAKQIVYSQSGLNRMIIGQISMSKPVMKKVADALEIPETEILSWIVADRYKIEVLEMAHNLLN